MGKCDARGWKARGLKGGEDPRGMEQTLGGSRQVPECFEGEGGFQISYGLSPSLREAVSCQKLGKKGSESS